ncbi:dihydrolipoamide acetyltransferase [Scleroderma citrinum]
MASSLARIAARSLHSSARRHALSRFAMPAMSPTMTEGGIATWKKKEGEPFAAGDVFAGDFTQDAHCIHQAPDGTKNVSVGSPIAIVAEEGDDLRQSQSWPRRPHIRFPDCQEDCLGTGIPLSKITGTGPEGRIIREDVEKYQPPISSSAATPATPSSEYTDIPVSNMRKVIGTRLTQSKQEVPHYYLTVEINMDKVLKLREVFNKTLGEKDKAAKLTCALNDVPEANSAWLGEVIRQYKKADISVAGLATISSEAKALAKKARDGKLVPQEYQPVIVPAPEEERGFKTANVMKVTLSSDHRTVDGAVGARWMSAFKSYLENPLTFML